jgi:hypothetical protein
MQPQKLTRASAEAAGFTKAEIDEYFGRDTSPSSPPSSSSQTRQQPSSPALPPSPPSSFVDRAKKSYKEGMQKDITDLTALFTNIPGAEEVGGAVTGLLPGGMNYQQGRQFVAQKREEAKGQMSGGRYAAVSAVPTVAAAYATGGKTILARALASAGIEGARGFLGAGAKPADTEAPSLGQRGTAMVAPALAAGGASAAIEGLLKVPAPLARGAVRLISKVPYGGPFIDAVGQSATGAGQSIARSASDVLAKRGAPFLEGIERSLPAGIARSIAGAEPSTIARALAQAIEPMDAQKIARLGAATLPGRAGSAAAGRIVNAAEKAEAAAAGMGEEVKVARSATTAAGKRIADKAEAINKNLIARAEQEASTTLQQLKAEADMTMSGLQNPVVSADALRTTTAKKLKDQAAVNYKALEKFDYVQQVDAATGTITPPTAVYGIIKRAKLGDDLEAASREKGTRLYNERVAAAQVGVPEAERAFLNVQDVNMPRFKTGQFRNPQTGELEDITVPKIDLEILDNLRQNVNNRITAFFNGAENGLSPKNGKLLLKDMDRIEKLLIDAMPAEAKAAVIAARGPYRATIVELQAIQDGLNLFKFGTPAAGKLKKGGKLDLGELEKTIETLYKDAPEAKAAFAVGAREAIANVANASTKDATAIAVKLVGSPLAKRRTALALGEDGVAQLEKFLPAQIERGAAAFGGPTARRAAQLSSRNAARVERVTGKLGERANVLDEAFQAQAGRAGQLRKVANIPYKQIMEGGQAAETFEQITSKGLGGFGQAATPNIFGSMLQTEMAKLTPKAALARLTEMEANPAMRQQMGPQIRSLIEQIQKKGMPASLKTARQLFIGQKAAELTR